MTDDYEAWRAEFDRRQAEGDARVAAIRAEHDERRLQMEREHLLAVSEINAAFDAGMRRSDAIYWAKIAAVWVGFFLFAAWVASLSAH